MVISCIGDSLTEGDYGIFGKSGIANVQKENYPYFLAELTGAKVHNFGKCGFTSTSYRKYYEEGTVNIKGSEQTAVLIRMSKRTETETMIYLSKCAVETHRKPKFIFAHRRMLQKTARVEKAVRFVRKYAFEYGFKTIKVAECTDFNDDTESIMQPNDGLHFGAAGYKKLAEFIASNLQMAGEL